MSHFSDSKIQPIHALRSPAKLDLNTQENSLESGTIRDKIEMNLKVQKKILDVKQLVLSTFKSFLQRFLKEAAFFKDSDDQLSKLKDTIQSIREKIFNMKDSIQSSKALIVALSNQLKTLA